MGKPYASEFRKQVVAAVESAGLSRNQAAKQFGDRHQHCDWLGESAPQDRELGAGPVGWSQAEGDFRRAPCLALAANQGWRLHRGPPDAARVLSRRG
jgi:hypothetical protein